MNRSLDPDDDEEVPETAPSSPPLPPEPPEHGPEYTLTPAGRTLPQAIGTIEAGVKCFHCGSTVLHVDSRGAGSAFCGGCGRTKKMPESG